MVMADLTSGKPIVSTGTKVKGSGDQTISNNTETEVTFWATELWDDDNSWSSGAASKIIMGTAGRKTVGAFIRFNPSTATGVRQVVIKHFNSSNVQQGFKAQTVDQQHAVADECYVSVDYVGDFAVGDYAKVFVFQKTGGNLDIKATESTFSSQTLNGIGGSSVSSAAMDAAFGSTQGNILYRDASGWVVLAPGTSGQFLKTLGAGANPLWASTPSGGTDMTGHPDAIPASPNSDDDEFNGNSLAGAWSTFTGTSATVSNGCLRLRDSAANNRLTGVYKSITGSTWVFAAKLHHLWDYVGSTTGNNGSYRTTALILRESGTNKTVTWGLMYYSGSSPNSTGEVMFVNGTIPNLSVNPGEGEFGNHFRPWSGIGNTVWSPPPVYVKVERTSTQILYSASLNGQDWVQINARTTTTDFTTAPDLVGLGITSYAGAALGVFDWFRRLA